MIPTHSHLLSNRLIRASLVLCASLAVMATVVGSDQKREKVSAAAINTSESIALDPAVFGSSAGQASIKAAPTTWSSRSNVRWNARWATEARYLV